VRPPLHVTPTLLTLFTYYCRRSRSGRAEVVLKNALNGLPETLCGDHRAERQVSVQPYRQYFTSRTLLAAKPVDPIYLDALNIRSPYHGEHHLLRICIPLQRRVWLTVFCQYRVPTIETSSAGH
jgi:hypothetical protein